MNDNYTIARVPPSVLPVVDKTTEEWRGHILKTLPVSMQSNRVLRRRAPSAWYYSWMFSPSSYIHYTFITSIFIIIQLCHLPSLSLILLHAKSAGSPPKVIQSLVLMGSDIALIVSVPWRTAALRDGRRCTPAFVNNSIPKGKLTKWVLSNYLCGEMIFSNTGGIPTVHTDLNNTCARVPAICNHLLKTIDITK